MPEDSGDPYDDHDDEEKSMEEGGEEEAEASEAMQNGSEAHGARAFAKRQKAMPTPPRHTQLHYVVHSWF